MKCKVKLWAYGPVALILLVGVKAYGRSIFATNEPIKVDPHSIYQTIPAPPGQPFQAVSYETNSIIEQLAHSSDGIIRLPPGDYSIPVRMY